jgi:subtilisin
LPHSGAATALSPELEHIVVFNDESSLLAFVDVLHRGTLRESAESKYLLHATPGNQEQPALKVFKLLKALATTLTPEELSKLKAANGSVFKNEVRELPPLAVEEVEALDAGSSPLRFSPQDEQPLTWNLEMIGIKPDYPLTGLGARLAVLDTGIDTTHPDFSNRISPSDTKSFLAGKSVQDNHGHGTHCAGIIAGPLNSLSGSRYSVAPDASLLIGKVLDDNGRGTDDTIFAGLQWALESHAKVVCMSFGKIRAAGSQPSEVYERIAAALRDSSGGGVLLVAAAGNESSAGRVHPLLDPSACKGIVAVTAVDEQGEVGFFSCGAVGNSRSVAVAAPGVAILSSYKGGHFARMTGTSMAAPHVAGIATLHLQSDPAQTALQLAELVTGRVSPKPIPPIFGRGIIQVP